MDISMNMGGVLKKYGRNVAEAAKAIKAAGFDAVDFDLCGMDEDDCEFNGDGYRELAARYRAEIEATGLYVNQTHTPFTFKNWDNEEHYNNVIYPRIVRSLEISALLGAEIAIVHPLHYAEYHGHEEEWFERNMVFYRSLLPYCEKYGIKIAVENMFRGDPRRKRIAHDTCSRKEEFIRYVDTLNSEYVVACLDVGHVGLPVQDDEAYDVARALGHDRLKALHIHDNDYQNDRHVPPYYGIMNWTEIAKSLGEIDYTGVFTYEIGSRSFATVEDEFMPVTLKYFADIARHITSMIDRSRPAK